MFGKEEINNINNNEIIINEKQKDKEILIIQKDNNNLNENIIKEEENKKEEKNDELIKEGKNESENIEKYKGEKNGIIEEGKRENEIKNEEKDDIKVEGIEKKEVEKNEEIKIEELNKDIIKDDKKENLKEKNIIKEEEKIIKNNSGDSLSNKEINKNSWAKQQRASCIRFIEDEKNDNQKIKGEESIENYSNNNLYYLGNLFRDVLNKYDNESDKDEEPRQFMEKIVQSKTLSRKQSIEDQAFNFSELINVQLNEVKQNTLSYLDKAKKELDKRYSLYINKINEYINENEIKISKVIPRFETNENFMNYADDKIFKQIEYILEIHENIFSALEDHISLLFTFLDQISLIQQKNPLEYFLNTNSNDILNCWFLSKINFDKLSLSNIIINKNLSDLVSGYLCKKRENNFAKITIQKDTKGNLSLETEFLRDNINNLKKLKFLGLPSDSVNQILNQIYNKKEKLFEEENQLDSEKIQIGKKLKSLSIIESNLSTKTELPKINLPVLRKVKIKKTRIPLNYFFDSIVGQTSFLKIINMQNCNLNDRDFLDFFQYLNAKTYLQESIQYLGFSGNDLSYINLKKFLNRGGLMKSLQYFDLSKNNIHEFVTDNFKGLPMLKVLDLSDNNISNYIFFDSIYSRHKKNKMPCLVLLSNNIFISNNKYNNREYRKYIYQCLTNFKYKIKKLNLSLLYNKDNNEDLTILRISPSVKISMIKLNLSFCGLKTETIWKFFINNYGLLNLVSLNLSYNFITNNFFYLCAGQDILLEKLRVIDLSMNQIDCKDINELKQIENFINNYQKLKKIKIQENNFMKGLFLLYDKNKNEINEIIERLKKKEIKFDVDSINYAIVNGKLNEIIELKDKSI